MIVKGKILQLFCILPIFLFVLPCDGDSNDVEDSPPFEVRLYSELVKATPKANIIYSPFSIKTCLAMASVGAYGQTALEMDKTLGLSVQNRTNLANSLKRYQNSPILRIVNKIYIMKDYKIQKKFYNAITQQFFAEIASVNFAHNVASASVINKWVQNKTNNLIKDLVSPDQLNKDSRFVLINAIHFKGEWASKFSVENTEDMPFYLDDNSEFDVKMMYQSGYFKTDERTDLLATVLEMPYKNSNLSMLIILPWYTTTLSDVEKKLNTIPLNNITAGLKEKSEYDLYFPRFKSEFKVDLKDPLINMGMKRMFTDDAEFNDMLTADQDLKVTSITHKAIIEVSEEGAEAAAATDVGAAQPLMASDSIEVNKPFYYIIKDEKDTKIFEGRINSKFTSDF